MIIFVVYHLCFSLALVYSRIELDLDVNVCEVANNLQLICNGNDIGGLEQQHRIENSNENQSKIGTGITVPIHQTAFGQQAAGGSNSTLDEQIDVALSNSQSDSLLDKILDFLQENKDLGK